MNFPLFSSRRFRACLPAAVSFAAGFAAALACRSGGGGGGGGGGSASAPPPPDCSQPAAVSDPDAPPRLSLSARLIKTLESDDTQPVVALFGPNDLFSSNVVDRLQEWVELEVDGRKTPFSVSRLANSRDGAALLLPDVESTGALVKVRVSTDFPAPDGMRPLAAPFEAEVWHSVEPVSFRDYHVVAGDWGEWPALEVIPSELRCTVSSIVDNLVFDPPLPGGVRAEADDWVSWWDMDGDRYVCGSGFRLSGPFRPGIRYRMALRPDAVLVSEKGARRVAATNSVSFAVREPDTKIEFCGTASGALAPTDLSAVALRTQGAGRIRATLNRVLPQNVLAASRFSWAGGYEENFCERTGPELEAFAPTAGVCTNSLALADFFSPDAEGASAASGHRPPDGLYRLRCEAEKAGAKRGEGPFASSECLVNLSDIGISARVVGQDLQAWVVGLRSGAPIPGARVALVGRNNAEMSSATADEDGVALIRLPPPDVVSAPEPALVLAQAPDGGYGFLLLDESSGTEEMAERPVDAFPASPGELDGFLFSDRGIYRHGDRVLLQGLVRDAAGLAPEPVALALELRRPDGNLFERMEVRTDARGFLSLPGGWEAPASQPSGKWRAALREAGEDGRDLAVREFSIEDFAPPKIAVELPDPAPAPGPCATNDGFRVAARWLFGAPASALSAKASVRAAHADWTPQPWTSNGWCFGSARGDFPHFSAEKRGLLDAGGEAAFDFDVSRLRGAWPFPVALVRSASVFEPGGRPVQASCKTVYHPYPHYVALRTSEADGGAAVRAEARLVRPDGSAADDLAGASIRLEFFAVKWESRLERQNSGAWAWRTERTRKLLGESEVEAIRGGASSVLFPLPPERSELEVVATAEAPEGFEKGPETVRSLSSWDLSGGAGDADSRGPNPVRLTLRSEADAWLAGDTARVAIHAPFPGRALATVQGRGVLSHFETTLAEGDNMVEVPLTRDHAPSCELSLVLVRPVDPSRPDSRSGSWRPHRACGAVTLRVRDPSRSLPLALDDPKLEPGRSGGATVSVRATIAGDGPSAVPDGAARATFLLVDEALLDITREPLPDPVARFGRSRASRARSWDSWVSLMPVADAPLLKTAAIGGDDMALAAKALADALLSGRVSAVASRRFVPLARAVSDVPFEQGEARATFDIPDFAGSLRVVCVAWTGGAAAAARKSVQVAPALVVEADGPRFLCAGDVSEATCTLHNNTDAPGDVLLRFAFDGAPPRERRVDVPAHGMAVVRESMAQPEGAADGVKRVRFDAEGLGERHSSGFELPVRPALPPRTFTETVELAPGVDATLAPPRGVLGGASVSAEVSALLPGDAMAVPALRWLRDYQWGCLEQTVSRALPLLVSGRAMGDLSDRVLDSPGEADARISAALARVGSMLRPSDFSVWPDGGWSNPEYSAWAGLFIAEAAGAGCPVAQSVRTGSRAVLRSLVRRAAPRADSEASRAERAELEAEFAGTRALALLGLAVDGTPDEGSAQRLLDMRDSLSAVCRARLAIVLFRTGHPEDGFGLLRSLEPLSDAQSAAWGLLAWLECPLSPGDPERARQVDLFSSRLAAARGADGHWGSTADNAVALIALAAGMRAAGSSAMPQTGAGSRAARVEVRMASAGADSAPVATLKADGKPLRLAGDEACGELLLRALGEAPVSVQRAVVASPLPSSDAARARSAGMSVSRRFMLPDGTPLDPAAGIAQGETVVVAVDVTPGPGVDAGHPTRDVVLDEWIPAGFEPELPSATAGAAARAIPANASAWIKHREVRDDRLVAFGESISGPVSFFYTAQAVSSGSYVLPPAVAEAMYDPAVGASTELGRVTITPSGDAAGNESGK